MRSSSRWSVLRVGGVRRHAPIKAADAERLAPILPREHIDLLAESNGLEAFGCYYRVFGCGGESIDMRTWNRDDTWKFAWGSRCAEYLCFAETAWGDQYAYKTDGGVRTDDRVYWLDALTMSAEVVCPSFQAFAEGELLKNATIPIDVMSTRARAITGDIDASAHVAYQPSLLLGGSEATSQIVCLPARTAMICNGDISMQIANGPDEPAVGVDTYLDAEGRTRLRLRWAK